MSVCSVCGSEHVFRRGRCDRDYRWWRAHGEDRMLTQAERDARTDRQNELRRQRENVRAAIMYAGG